MEKVWLKSYPPGVPAEVDLNACPTLIDLMDKSFREYSQRGLVDFMGKQITYAEIDRQSRALGAWLQSLGMAPGSRVAIMMPNVPQYVVALCAILRAGHVVVNVNPLYTPRELEHQLKDSGAEAIIVMEMFATTVEQVIKQTNVKHVVLASIGDMLGLVKGFITNYVVRNIKKAVPAYNLPGATWFNDAVSRGGGMTLKMASPGPEDLAFLQYTGGTTGVSKGAMLVHRNVAGNVLVSEAWLEPALHTDKPIEQMKVVVALPLYHIFALVSCLWLGMRGGALCILIPNPRDFDSVVKALQPHKVNLFPAVNTLFNAMAMHPGFQQLDFSDLRISNGGGMAVQRAVADRWKALTGSAIVEGYGLTETTSGATCNPVMSDAYTATVGLPMPSTEIDIRDDEGKSVAIGQPGEICIRGPQVMVGYWQRPDETAKVMFDDGFFRSGDIGVMEANGYIKIVDRKKDMILVSGFNVYPNEIEDVVAMHPGVMECAAVGVPDEHSGEAVKLVVVKKDPALTKEALAEYCKENLTGYKRPRVIEFRDSLPKTNVGKVLRRALRDAG
ncbi:MAG: long-chain-fatty-acid--CoA ligase [Betaproteobacteria bacterium]|nr:long-chain-fatty-acid--CoA ligase [Betaproteobacteria bacterium]